VCLGNYLYYAFIMLVDPTAPIRRHLERGRYVEQTPVSAILHEDALPVRAEQAEVAMYGRQEAIDADVSFRHHRVEDAAHPCGGGECCLVGCCVSTRAQQVAVWPLHTKLLASQHYVTVCAMKERQQLPALVGFLVAPL